MSDRLKRLHQIQGQLIMMREVHEHFLHRMEELDKEAQAIADELEQEMSNEAKPNED